MKNIIVSGGSEGLGLAVAKKLSKSSNVYILARTEKNLVKVSKQIGCNYKVCDVSDWFSVEKCVKEIEKDCKKIDVLVTSAALWIQGPLQENDPQQIKDVINVNTTGVIYLTKAVLPNMQKHKSGTIIHINSQGGLYGKSERSVYTASKWAVTGFTKSMFSEVYSDGIRVMGIYPGKMNTHMFKKVGIKKDMSDALDKNKVAEAVEFMINQDNNVTIPELGIVSI